MLASASTAGGLRLWNTDTGVVVWESRFPVHPTGDSKIEFVDDDSQLLVHMGGSVFFYDPNTGKLSGRLQRIRPQRLTVTSDNRVIAADRGGTLRLYPAIPTPMRER